MKTKELVEAFLKGEFNGRDLSVVMLDGDVVRGPILGAKLSTDFLIVSIDWAATQYAWEQPLRWRDTGKKEPRATILIDAIVQRFILVELFHATVQRLPSTERADRICCFAWR